MTYNKGLILWFFAFFFMCYLPYSECSTIPVSYEDSVQSSQGLKRDDGDIIGT
jgi:hypothetical protein